MNLEDAIKMATIFAKSGDVNRRFIVGAIGFRRDGCAVVARNEGGKEITLSAHAEARLVRKLGQYASLVVVVRLHKDGTFAMAKPCVSCQRVLRQHKVQKIMYTTDTGVETF